MKKQIKAFIKNHHIIKQHTLFISYLIIGILIIMLIITNFRIIGSPISKKVDTYYYSHMDFGKLTGKDIHQIWLNKYYYAKYQLDGNSKNEKYDCFSAVLSLLQDLGANIKLQTVENFYKTLTMTSLPRYNIGQVKERDLIIFRVNSNNWHIGIITKILGNRIYYCDMNAIDGAGFNKVIEFNNWTIKGIYPIMLNLWMGDILKNI